MLSEARERLARRAGSITAFTKAGTMFPRLGLLTSARRFDRALAVVTYIAVIVASLAYVAKLNEARENLAHDVELVGYRQVAGERALAMHNSALDYASVLLQGNTNDADATWRVTPGRNVTAARPERTAFVFVIGPWLSFGRHDGMATVSLDGRRLATIHAGPRIDGDGRFVPDVDATTIDIPPSADNGWRFQLSDRMRCAPACSLRLDIRNGEWNVQRVGVSVYTNSRVGPPLWTESARTIAVVVVLSIVACVASSRIVHELFRRVALL